MTARLLPLLGNVLLLALLAVATASAGVPGVTTRISVASDGTQGDSESWFPAISADGRYVAFNSLASNLMPSDTNGALDVFVYDRTTHQTVRASVASTGTEGNGNSWVSAISADGRLVAFYSYASNLVPGDTNGALDVFVRDLVANTTTRVSVASDGTQGNSDSWIAAMSADGRYVAFMSAASNLVSGDTNGKTDVFVRDRLVNTTTRVSVASDGAQANGDSDTPAISADGRYVAFASRASNLVPDDTNGKKDIFVYDRWPEGWGNTTSRVSVAWLALWGAQANDDSGAPAISADGRYVAFGSGASNLVWGDTNDTEDVFVYDRNTRFTELVSMASDGTQGNSSSYVRAISADGRYVPFESWASNLVAGDTNGGLDVFVRDLVTGVTTRVSVASDGSEAKDGWSSDGAISANGRTVAFMSYAGNLVPGDTNGTGDVFVRDRCPAGNCAAFHRTHSQPDFDATNKADLLWRHATNGQDAVWLMNGASPPSIGMIPTANTSWKIVGVGDLDGDAKTDLVWRNTGSGQVIAWFMNGASLIRYAWLPSVADLTWKLAAVADLNQDNQADLLWRNTATGENVAWLMNGSAVASYAFLPSVTDPAWALIAVGDLNGDEMADLIWRNPSTGQNMAWLMDSATGARYEWLPTVLDVNWTLIGVGDLNADYDADLVWHNTVSGQNVAWLMRGSSLDGYAFLPTVTDTNWKLVAVSDLDGDGKADLVWRNVSSGQNIAWMMNGGSVASYAWLDTVADTNWRVVSPTSLMAAFNGLLPGPTEIGATKVDANAPMASEALKDAKPMWSAAPKDAPPMGLPR